MRRGARDLRGSDPQRELLFLTRSCLELPNWNPIFCYL
jgi:hypothetical protein